MSFAIEHMVRNPKAVHADLVVKNDVLITKGGCFIYIPVSYESKELTIIGTTVKILGEFIITTDHKTYGVSKCTAMPTIMPTKIDIVKGETDEYYRFTFAPGSVVMPSTKLVKNSSLVYPIVVHFYDYGRIPFWMDVIHHSELLSRTGYWNGLQVFKDQVTHDIYSAHLQRSLKDPTVFFRNTVKSGADLNKRALFLALREPSLNKTSRLAKITDSRLKIGIRDALLHEPVRPEELEDIYMR